MKDNGYTGIRVTRTEPVSSDSGRKKKVRRRKGMAFYLVLVLLLAGIGMFICANYLFEVKYVQVSGISKYTPEEIVESSEIKYGDKLFNINKNELKEKLKEQYSYIENVKIRRKYPDTLIIEIEQRKAAVCTLSENGYILMDINGNILERDLVKEPYGVINVKGNFEKPEKPIQDDFSTRQSYLEAKIEYETELGQYNELINTMKAIVSAINKIGLKNITYIDLNNLYNIEIVCSERITIAVGTQSKLDYKMEMVKKVIEDELPRGQKYYINAKNAGTVSYRQIKD